MNVRRALRSRPFTAGAIAAAILIGLVTAAALAPPTLVNIAGEGTLVVGIERPTRPAITGGRATSIVDGWYAAPLHRPIVSHWNAPVGPTGNWAELRFEPPRAITGTTLFWGVGEVAPRSFDVRADFGEGYEVVASYRGLGAEAVPIALPAQPVHGLRVDIHEGYSETDTAHWAEWLVFEEQPALRVLLLESVAPLVRRLLVALAFLAVILVPGFTIARRLPGRPTRNASFVVGIPIALSLLGGLSALILWRSWPAWPPLIILGAIAAYGVGHPSTRRDLARLDRRMLAIAAAGTLLHVLVWHFFDALAPKHGGDTLYPLEVARVFMTQTPLDTPDLRHTLFGYPVGFRTPLLSLVVAPFLGVFGNDVTTYLTLIYAASGLFYVPAYALIRRHMGQRAVLIGGALLLFNSALFIFTEQLPNKLLAQVLVLVAVADLAQASKGEWLRPGLRAGSIVALAYFAHNSAIVAGGGVLAYAFLRGPVGARVLRPLALAVPVALAVVAWAVWTRAYDVPSDAIARTIVSNRFAAQVAGEDGVVDPGDALAWSVGQPLGVHISNRLIGLGSIVVWDFAGSRYQAPVISPQWLSRLIPRVGLFVFLIAMVGLIRAPPRARFALVTLLLVPALLVAAMTTQPGNNVMGWGFAFFAIFAGLAGGELARDRYPAYVRRGVLLLAGAEFVAHLTIIYAGGLGANLSDFSLQLVLPIAAALLAVVTSLAYGWRPDRSRTLSSDGACR